MKKKCLCGARKKVCMEDDDRVLYLLQHYTLDGVGDRHQMFIDGDERAEDLYECERQASALTPVDEAPQNSPHAFMPSDRAIRG